MGLTRSIETALDYTETALELLVGMAAGLVGYLLLVGLTILWLGFLLKMVLAVAEAL